MAAEVTAVEVTEAEVMAVEVTAVEVTVEEVTDITNPILHRMEVAPLVVGGMDGRFGIQLKKMNMNALMDFVHISMYRIIHTMVQITFGKASNITRLHI